MREKLKAKEHIGVDRNNDVNDIHKALRRAIERDNTQVLDSYLNNNGDPNSTVDKNNTSILSWAIHNNATKCIKLLIKHGVDVNQVSSYGWTPLCVSLEMRKLALFRALLYAGADPNKTNDAGYPPLNIAITYDIATAIKPLLDRGAKTDIINGKSVWGIAKRERMFAILLKNNVDPGLVDLCGRNALHYAAKLGKQRFVKKLIRKYGLNPNQKDQDGNTPIILAAENANSDTCLALLDAGADVETTNNSGFSAIDAVAGAANDVGDEQIKETTKILTIALSKANLKHLSNIIKKQAKPHERNRERLKM